MSTLLIFCRMYPLLIYALELQNRLYPRLSLNDQIEVLSTWAIDSLIGLGTEVNTTAPVVLLAVKKKVLTLLGQMCGNPQAVLDTMAAHGAVLSGSRVVHFVRSTEVETATDWIPHDWDFYVASNEFPGFLAGFLAVVGGAVVDEQRWDYNGGISHRSVVAFGNQHCDIICSTATSPFLPIARFDMTLVMNAISATGLCVAYPDLTFRRRSIMRPITWAPTHVTRWDKYTTRGYIMSPTEADSEELRSYERGQPAVTRYLGDSRCVTLMFGMETVHGVRLRSYWRLHQVCTLCLPVILADAFHVRWMRLGQKTIIPTTPCRGSS